MATRQQDLQAEQDHLQELVRRAGVSREFRRQAAAVLKLWYERGTASGEAAVYNKLSSHLDRVASYLWSAETVRFAVHVPPAVRPEWLPAAAVARDEFRQAWADAGADLIVTLALEWSLVYGCEILKVLRDPFRGFSLAAIDPWDFGVTREDQGDLEDQDVMVHWYTLSVPQFERWAYGDPEEDRLLRLAEDHKTTPSGGTTASPRPVVTGLTGGFPNTVISGAFPGEPLDAPDSTDPLVIEPIVLLADVWERGRFRDPFRKDVYEDWKVTTVLSEAAQEIVVSRRNPILDRRRTGTGIVLPGDHPFAVLAPRPLPNYTWGRSELAKLLGLQEWREDHIIKMRQVIARQLDPAKFFSGISDWEEAGRALTTPGGAFGSPEQGAKMEPIKVEVGQEAFGLLQQIDTMFADQGGLPPSTQGEPSPNMRSGSQLMGFAGIGAGRIRRQALHVEATLGRVATLAFRVLQRVDDQAYPLPDGGRFLLAQLPPGISLSVSAHSSAPIFAEQTQAKALELKQAGAINGPWLVELLDPPYREELKEEAAKLEAGRAQHQERLLELQVAKLAKRGGPGPKLPG